MIFNRESLPEETQKIFAVLWLIALWDGHNIKILVALSFVQNRTPKKRVVTGGMSFRFLILNPRDRRVKRPQGHRKDSFGGPSSGRSWSFNQVAARP